MLLHRKLYWFCALLDIIIIPCNIELFSLGFQFDLEDSLSMILTLYLGGKVVSRFLFQVGRMLQILLF